MFKYKIPFSAAIAVINTITIALVAIGSAGKIDMLWTATLGFIILTMTTETITGLVEKRKQESRENPPPSINNYPKKTDSLH